MRYRVRAIGKKIPFRESCQGVRNEITKQRWPTRWNANEPCTFSEFGIGRLNAPKCSEWRASKSCSEHFPAAFSPREKRCLNPSGNLPLKFKDPEREGIRRVSRLKLPASPKFIDGESRGSTIDNLARPRATVKGKSYERVGAFVVESQRARCNVGRLCKSQRVTVKLHPRH